MKELYTMPDAAHQQHTDGFAQDMTPLKKESAKVEVVLKQKEASLAITDAEAYETGV